VGSSTAIGSPTTVVEASELSVPAILEGIRHGRVFIDLTGSHDKVIDLEASDSTSDQKNTAERVQMGGTLRAAAGDPVAFRVRVDECQGAMVHIIVDGRKSADIGPLAIGSGSEALQFQWKAEDGRHWIRAEVRDANGSLMLVSNPIYISDGAPR